MDYQITIVDPDTGLVTLGIPSVPRILTGIQKLTQIVALSFLRNPGKSVFFPAEGSGLRQDIGQYNLSSEDPGAELRARAVQAVQAVQQEVIGRQDSTQGSPSEKLQSLALKDFAFDPLESRAVLRVQIVAESGDSRDVLV